MIPKTLSASSIQVWELCPDRWAAEYLDRGAGMSGFAADIGTSVHGGLEAFVKAVFIDKTHVGLTRVQQKELLISFYQMSYVQTFGTADMDTAEYKDGFALTMRWFERTDLSTKPMMGVETVEVKRTIPVPYNHPDGTVHEMPFNYIMDRVDRLEETVWEVVDYKTVRVPIQPEDLEVKVQARAYALAIQIEHPECTKVKVTFDLLRHQSISLWFTRDDNIAFWRFLCDTTQEIVNKKREEVRPRLNPECGFCIKKATCPLMTSNIAVGGIHSLTIDESIEKVALLKDQMKANKRLVEELEEIIYMHAAQTDMLQWETGDGARMVEITAPNVRTFPFDQAAAIMGPDLVAQMGNMTLGNLDKIIKDESIDKSVRDALTGLITTTTGNLRLNIKPKKKVF